MSDLFQKYRNKALHLLKYRPRSIAEIKRRLHQSGAEKSIIDAVVKSLVDYNLLNDAEFSIWLVNSRMQSTKPRGPNLLKAELATFGVSREIINQAMSDYSQEDYVIAAVKLLEKYGYRWQKLEDSQLYQKAYAFLNRKGFSSPEIRSAIDAWMADQ